MPFRPSHPALDRALAARGYADPTPVQDAVLAPDAERRDLTVSAETGSGKTVAYGLAVAQTLLGERERFDPETGEPMALVIAPTRELALQVQRELAWLYNETGARIVACVGGMDARAEARKLAGGAHVVVGTPGRLRDHVERRALRLGALRAVILDEADEMLDLGFREDLEFLLDATPPERRTLLFSATLPDGIARLAKRYQHDALRIEATRPAAAGHADIEYRAVRIVPNEAEHAVVNVLRFTEAPGALVFCNTREQVRHLHSGLVERGFAAVSLSGEMGQNERNAAMQALRDGRARVCVATDVAARGIDLPSLGLVIHAELPKDAETLQHRSGRTGRAGRKGVSVLLIPLSRRRKAERLLAEAGVRPSWGGAPTVEDIRRLDEERLLADPIFVPDEGENDGEAAKALAERHSAEALAGALLRLYRSRLPAPEEVFDPGQGREEKPRDFADRKAPKARKGEADLPKGGPRGATVWFRMNIGRRNDADPKWLLPMICRRGKVSRAEVGAIRVFDRETKFEIDAEAAQNFRIAVERGGEDDAAITLADGPAEGGGPAGRPRGDDRRDRKNKGAPPAFKRDAKRGASGGDRAAGKPHRGKRPAG